LNQNRSTLIKFRWRFNMKSQQICSGVLVAAVAVLLALMVFVGGCHGVNW
jgi:hypothetical protein